MGLGVAYFALLSSLSWTRPDARARLSSRSTGNVNNGHSTTFVDQKVVSVAPYVTYLPVAGKRRDAGESRRAPFDVRHAPRLVEELLVRTIQTEDDKPSTGVACRDPVVLPADRSVRCEVNVNGAIRVPDRLLVVGVKADDGRFADEPGRVPVVHR